MTCFKDYRTYLEENGHDHNSQDWLDTYMDGNRTCLLEEGHEGDHEWTSDRDILISFKHKEA